MRIHNERMYSNIHTVCIYSTSTDTQRSSSTSDVILYSAQAAGGDFMLRIRRAAHSPCSVQWNALAFMPPDSYARVVWRCCVVCLMAVLCVPSWCGRIETNKYRSIIRIHRKLPTTRCGFAAIVMRFTLRIIGKYMLAKIESVRRLGNGMNGMESVCTLHNDDDTRGYGACVATLLACDCSAINVAN